MRRVFIAAHKTARQGAADYCMQCPDGYVIRFEEPKRTLDQNALLWPLLEAFASQVPWPVNGILTHISADDWKTILTAAFRRELQRVAPGIDGGMVILGARTSKMGKREFSDLIEFIYAAGAARGVDFDAEKLEKKTRKMDNAYC